MAQDELNDRIYSNIDKASVHNIDLAFLFSNDQLKALARYKDSGANENIMFFSLLPTIAHFAQKSVYLTRYNSLKALNLFSVVMGPSGSGKTPNMSHVMNAAFDVIHLFPQSYFADLKLGKDMQQRCSITSIPNGYGLQLLLQESDTFIYNDEIDGVFNKFGMFGSTATEDIPVLCKAFDQIQNYERITGSSLISINNSRLSILGGTTGSTYSAVLKQFKNGQRLDGLCNRRVYLAIQREKAKEPMESFKVSSNDGIPSIKHVLIVVHLMKNIEYRFRTHDSGMTRTTTTTTEGAVSTNTLGTNILDADSAYYYVYNRTAAHYNQLFDKNLKIERYLEGFYSKSQEIYPRFCVLFQIYVNTMAVLNELSGMIQFDDVFVKDDKKTNDFIEQINIKINKLILSGATVNNDDSSIEDIFDNANKEICTDGEKILRFKQNWFTESNITRYNRPTNTLPGYNGPLFKQSERFYAAIKSLKQHELVTEGRYLVGCKHASYSKNVPPRISFPPTSEQLDFERHLSIFGITLTEYYKIFEESSSDALLTAFAATHMAHNYTQYINEFVKYSDQLFVRQEINNLIETGVIKEKTLSDGEIKFLLTEPNASNDSSIDRAEQLITFLQSQNQPVVSTSPQQPTAITNASITTSDSVQNSPIPVPTTPSSVFLSTKTTCII
ncbi:unnamed protein product [Didymodactylos carnosus]|uniref:Uncharacterized protein n=1 Tax=Didymodactylos carnosus TaxID=1234261 RepID=A0A814ZKF9_9BILA|nr:unnamed protein product [Didymodactylos carnosus]CAF4006727.1 unnamed protein product [Didymodactylos carnosus]